MNNRLYNAFDRLALKKQDKTNLIPGLLGFMINGTKTVEVQNRPGYVYVRLRNNTNEMIVAFNDQVSPVYDLPVLVVRDDIDMTRYKISGRDVGKYENWGSVSSYLPRHGNQHSFSPESGGGGDIVWVYDKQFTPLLVQPSGSSGAGNVTIGHDTIFQRNTWKSVGGTGTADLLTYKPTGSSARLVLVYLDQNGNPQTVLGSFFDSAITGTAAIVPYIPYPSQTWDIPLGAVRLVSGTSVILWENIYDLRAILRDATTTGTSSGVQLTIQENGIDQTQRDRLNFVGSAFDLYDNGSATIVSGTVPTIFPTIIDIGNLSVSGTSTFNGNINITGSIDIDTNSASNGLNFWDSVTATLQKGGVISLFVSNESPPGNYFYRSDAYGAGNLQNLSRLYSGSSLLATNIFGRSAGTGTYFLVNLMENSDYDFYLDKNYTQIGQIGRISRGLVIGSRQSEAGTVVPPTGTVMLRNIATPSSSPAGYTTIYSASGTPKAIDSSGNIFSMDSPIYGYAPSWTTTGTQPAIGNGTLTGTYAFRGDYCLLHMAMIAGSTTTFGTGYWEFGLPAGIAVASGTLDIYFGNGKCREVGVGSYFRFPQISQNATKVSFFIPADANVVTQERLDASTPFAWGASDNLYFQIEFRYIKTG